MSFSTELPFDFLDDSQMHLCDHPDWLCWVDCASTNTWALQHAAELPAGTVVFTRRQTAGRGQQGRAWYAPIGGLTASFVLRLPAAHLPGLSLAAGLAVIEAVEILLPDLENQLRLKWPNDVLFEQRKLAGILSEASTQAQSAVAVVGVGLNWRVDFTQADCPDTTLQTSAISLHQISRRVAELIPTEIPPESLIPIELELLTQIRQYLLLAVEQLTQAASLAPFLPKLRQRDILLYRSIKLDTGSVELLSGQAMGIDDSGRLLLQLPTGEVKAFASGRVQDWVQ